MSFNIQTGKEKLAEYLKIPPVEAKNIIDSFLGTGFQVIACYIIVARKSFYRDVLKTVFHSSYIFMYMYVYNSISKFYYSVHVHVFYKLIAFLAELIVMETREKWEMCTIWY